MESNIKTPVIVAKISQSQQVNLVGDEATFYTLSAYNRIVPQYIHNWISLIDRNLAVMREKNSTGSFYV